MGKLLAALSELVLTIAGGLLLFLGASGRFWADRKSPAWIGLAILLVYLGVRSFWTARRGVGRYSLRWERYVRGGSLSLVGGPMLAASGLAAAHLGPLMGAAGGTLVLRGLANAVLALRSR
jgi:hypothetical protein